jgi:hypothetical protein
MSGNTAIWTYRNDVDPTPAWVGYSVHAFDGDFGKIDELCTEIGRGNIVVGIGSWLFGKKRLIPASSVCVSATGTRARSVAMSGVFGDRDRLDVVAALRRLADNHKAVKRHPSGGRRTVEEHHRHDVIDLCKVLP